MTSTLLSTIFLFGLPLLTSALGPGISLSYNGLALTPSMGWDTYNSFSLNYNESILQTSAQRLVDLGFRDLGYRVIILDDATFTGRSANGTLVANETRFPSGLKSLGDGFHDLGLKLGMYSSAGNFTCGGYPGGLGYETQDANLWATYGTDYVKYDNCFNAGQSGTPLISYNRYKVMSDALNATGRPMVYSLCNWGDDKPWEWGSLIANSWRISGDIFDSFDQPTASCPCGPDEYYCELPGYACSVMNILNKASGITSKAQAGGWNDLDMLEVGNGAMTDDEYKTHFSMWAAMKSPLIMGNNLATLTPADYSILANPAVIAINQDPGATSIARRWRHLINDTDEYGQGEIALWSGSLGNGDQVVALINAGNTGRTIKATLVDIFGGLTTAAAAKQSWDVYDLWGNRMSNATAAAILAGSAPASNATGYYNATATSFADGLSGGDSLLFGKKIKTVAAQGTLAAFIPRHGIGFYRLRQVDEQKSEL